MTAKATDGQQRTIGISEAARLMGELADAKLLPACLMFVQAAYDADVLAHPFVSHTDSGATPGKPSSRRPGPSLAPGLTKRMCELANDARRAHDNAKGNMAARDEHSNPEETPDGYED
jgi:hypothetical protein